MADDTKPFAPSPEAVEKAHRLGGRVCGGCRGYGCYSYFPLGCNGVVTDRCSDCRGTGIIVDPKPPIEGDTP